MTRILRFRLSVAALALMVPSVAWADCATTTAANGTVTLNCGNTATTPANNSSGNTPSTTAQFHFLNAPISMTINSGTTITNFGLGLFTGGTMPSATPQPITVINNGIISHTAGFDIDSQADGLRLSTNSGPISYSGNGSVTSNGRTDATTGQFSTGLIIFTSGQANSITVGSQAAPVSGTFSGESGIYLAATDSSTNAWFNGGTITATRASAGIAALAVTASGNLNLTMTGRTVVNGGINAGLQTGAGFTAGSAVTIATDAQVTDSYTAGAGLSVFSRQGGADVTLTNGALFNVANIGVLLTSVTGTARFTTAAGSTINQTGTTGALRAGLWFTPSGTGSLIADLSGTIAASGTGVLLSPTNGNAVVTIRAGGSVSGDVAGIQVTQASGSTGAVDIRNLGTLTGAAAVNAAPTGTAFTLTNSGTLTGSVNVTGSSIASSLLTNSGTWNTGAGNSVFAGSVTNGGTMNMANGAANMLTVNGNLVLTAASNLRLDVGATQAATDRILVTGTATLAGSLAAFASGGTFTAGTYTLLTANGGRTGTFSPLATTPNTTASLNYDANNVFLVISAAPGTSESFSTRDSLVFNAPTVATNRTTSFSTQIIGRLLGGTPLYDQTFAAAFASASVQNGITAARAAITAAGGPGVIIGDPVRTASSMTSVTTTGTSTYSLAGSSEATPSVVITFGPATIQVGALSTCNASSLPSGSRPSCATGGNAYRVGDNETNFNTITGTVYTINETRTDTITETLRETYQLNGQVVAVGSVHAEVQSGLFDLGARLLTRLGMIGQGNAGWADFYAFRVDQAGQRDARGLAGGFGLQIGEGLTLGLGVDHGRIDIDLPGARESGKIGLTEIGASLRFDSGPFAASLAVVQGFGNAETRRSIIGRSDADYDVRVTGAALDMGYIVETGDWTLRPEAGIDWVRLSTDAFGETDTLGLVAPGGSVRQVRATAGLGVARDFGAVTLSARARYLAVLDGSARTVPIAFALAPTRQLTMSAPGEPDGVLLGARIGVPLGGRASVSVGYDGRLGGGYTSHAVTAGVRVMF